MVLLRQLLRLFQKLRRYTGLPTMLKRLVLATSVATLLAAVGAEARADASLERIREQGVIRLGYRTDAEPFSHLGETGKPTGYTIAVCDAVVAHLSRHLGREIEVEFVKVTTVSDDRFRALADGRLDLLCEASTITFTRRRLVDFSSIIYVTGAGVLFRKDGAAGFDDLGGHRIGVLTHTTTARSIEDYLIEHVPDAQLIRYESHDEGFEALRQREITAYFADRDLLVAFFARLGGDGGELALSDRHFTIEQYGLAMPRDNPDFRFEVDRAIAELFRSGEGRNLMLRHLSQKPTDLHEAMFSLFAFPPE